VARRFFVDETDLALGRALAGNHPEVVYPGHAELAEVPRGALDDDWLPVIGAKQLVVITRDRRIRYRPVEKRLWITHRVRGFVLTGQRSQSTVDSLSILERHWTHIEALVDTRPDGPWMYAATDQHLREITLS
jgi:PIN like domain